MFYIVLIEHDEYPQYPHMSYFIKNARPKRSEGEEKTRQNDINVIWRPDLLGVEVISKVSRDLNDSPY